MGCVHGCTRPLLRRCIPGGGSIDGTAQFMEGSPEQYWFIMHVWMNGFWNERMDESTFWCLETLMYWIRVSMNVIKAVRMSLRPKFVCMHVLMNRMMHWHLHRWIDSRIRWRLNGNQDRCCSFDNVWINGSVGDVVDVWLEVMYCYSNET